MGKGFLEVLPAEDISIGGIGIRLDYDVDGYSLQAPVELLIALPQEKAFLARGFLRHKRVDRNTGARIFGVEFKALPDEERQKLQRYVDRMVIAGREC